jgi:hypothetical protein
MPYVIEDEVSAAIAAVFSATVGCPTPLCWGCRARETADQKPASTSWPAWSRGNGLWGCGFAICYWAGRFSGAAVDGRGEAFGASVGGLLSP